jgi:hypothetical protein
MMFFQALFVAVALATEPVVKVLNGSYSGLHLPQFGQDIFLGIPYAQGMSASTHLTKPTLKLSFGRYGWHQQISNPAEPN